MLTIIVISDEDYVDALALSQQNANSSSLLDLAIVEVGSSLLISTVNLVIVEISFNTVFW